ncbi:armadillo-type protein [Mycena vitilis]|nr:armadillo-type protein [Mycena vitilis]
MVSLTKIAAEFRRSIVVCIPKIIDMLKHYMESVRAGGAAALATLSERGKYHARNHMMLLTSTTADFRQLIGSSIPQIIDLLKDNSQRVRLASVAALATFSEQGMYHVWTSEFRGPIETSIPQIVSLLMHKESSVRAMAVLSKLSERVEFRGSVGTYIPQIVDLLDVYQMDSTCSVQMEAMTLLSNLSEKCMQHVWTLELRRCIGTYIPQMVAMLKDVQKSRSITGLVEALTMLSEQAELRVSIRTSIPDIVNLLRYQGSGPACVNALVKFSKQVELRGSIGTCIPQIVALLEQDQRCQAHVWVVLANLFEQGM